MSNKRRIELSKSEENKAYFMGGFIGGIVLGILLTLAGIRLLRLARADADQGRIGDPNPARSIAENDVGASSGPCLQLDFGDEGGILTVGDGGADSGVFATSGTVEIQMPRPTTLDEVQAALKVPYTDPRSDLRGVIFRTVARDEGTEEKILPMPGSSLYYGVDPYSVPFLLKGANMSIEEGSCSTQEPY